MRRTSRGATDPCPIIAFQRCPAKTFTSRGDGLVHPGHTAPVHCQIVGQVARALVARFPFPIAQRLFPAGSELVAACHDIGKVSPTFYEKLRRACQAGVDNWLTLPSSPVLESQWGGHAGTSQIAARAMGVPERIPEILGMHHGFSPPVAGKRARDEIFGGPEWQAQRVALVEHLKSVLQTDWPELKSAAQARTVAGLTSVADWIGSGEFFEDPSKPWEACIEEAVTDAGFIVPQYRQYLSFQDIFGFSPRPAQQTFIDHVSQPGVHVLEAPMGLGKTEAALYVAYCLMAQRQATGLYFALPTQLTSNKIHERVSRFLEAILAPDEPHRALLLHGKAWLQQTEMGEEGRPGGAWFNHAKRGLLAPFAVGTIDQALMAAMRVKHGFVRAFGLAGKVVVLDEVHSYDAYTGTLLDALVALLRELGCTVIILSATLNQARRAEILATPLTGDAYPLLTSVPEQGSPTEIALPANASRTVSIALQGSTEAAVEETLKRASEGQQVLWIENTVAEAQTRYLDLAARAAEIGVDCGLLHSRFTVTDRERLEAHWTHLFGRDGHTERSTRGRILVGTQVLEQSLDLDADFLVTRFAPTDMVLQRLGRLWRHDDTPRPATARAEAWLLAPDLEQATEQPLSAFGASAYVYAPYVLCRSLEVWQNRTQATLPDDIRGLINQTYADRDEVEPLSRWLHELEHGDKRGKIGREGMRQLANLSLAEEGNVRSDTNPPTRYSEIDSAEVLLLRNLQTDIDSSDTQLTLLDGSTLQLPRARHALSRSEWKALTARLMTQQVPVRIHDGPKALDRHTLEKRGFGHCFYLGDPSWKGDESLLRIALVDETGTLRGVDGVPVHDKHSLEYRDDLGYRVLKS